MEELSEAAELVQQGILAFARDGGIPEDRAKALCNIPIDQRLIGIGAVHLSEQLSDGERARLDQIIQQLSKEPMNRSVFVSYVKTRENQFIIKSWRE